MTSGVILHDLGDPVGGAAWREVLATRPQLRRWVSPDLPGHGSQPAPATGTYDVMVSATVARIQPPAEVVVGVGANAHAALIVAAGGGCGRVVIVDGLHGRFRSAVAEVAAGHDRVRALAADAAATGPAPAAGLDPRARHGYGITISGEFLQRFWGAVTVPVLAIETPTSITPPAARATRSAWFGGASALVEVGADTPAVVLDAIEAWLTGDIRGREPER